MTENNTAHPLTPRQMRAIGALLECRSNLEAAARAGIAPKTLYRWLKSPLFVAELQAAENKVIDGSIRRLAGLTGAAVEVLGDIMANPAAKHAVRVQAANVTLARFGDLHEEQELERRLTRLEEDLKHDH